MTLGSTVFFDDADLGLFAIFKVLADSGQSVCREFYVVDWLSGTPNASL